MIPVYSCTSRNHPSKNKGIKRIDYFLKNDNINNLGACHWNLFYCYYFPNTISDKK